MHALWDFLSGEIFVVLFFGGGGVLNKVRNWPELTDRPTKKSAFSVKGEEGVNICLIEILWALGSFFHISTFFKDSIDECSVFLIFFGLHDEWMNYYMRDDTQK